MHKRGNEQSYSILIAIAIFKLFKALLLIAVAFGVRKLLHGDAEDVLRHWVHAVRIDPDNEYIHAAISKVTGLNEGKLKAVSAGTFAYGLLFLVEGIGLLARQRWAEYLTVVSTSGLLPLEIYELVHHFTPAKAVVLVLNALIVVYLIVRLYRTRQNVAAKHATS